ncbi:cytochrome b5 B [Tieghemostelium lacteum]|uniref:Cytochrome b5 B n=1 Tax=Tieghemostelium lacteum TaxID=361077 RepID=A0A152A398_TIELA|nr:cytochrome b5 B [Tieghemostelium lacteum]|eukprot:KYR00718.1 cytochrome b5 B [Tieghemostelium lacteum]
METQQEFTLEEIQKHTTLESLWIIINGNVYDVTSYADTHPGGIDVLLENAGKDATNEFLDIGHSQVAMDQLKELFIGVYKPTPNSSSNTTNNNNIQQPQQRPTQPPQQKESSVPILPIVIGAGAVVLGLAIAITRSITKK